MASLHEASEDTTAPSLSDTTDHRLEVLVLDDNAFDLRRMGRMLQGLSLEVRIQSCQSLDAFEEALDAKTYDVCLIDHHLGTDANGSDALAMVRAHARNGHVPGILVSGITDPALIVDAIQGGFANFVDKDALSIARLSRVVADALEEAAEHGLSDAKRQKLLSSVLAQMAETYAETTRPHLREIYSKVDFVRQCLARRELPDPSVLDEVEDNCFAIWRFLDDYPNHGFQTPPKLH